MAYPINPPACPYVLRKDLGNVEYEEDGILKSEDWWFWSPPRKTESPDDWFVGPYPYRTSAMRHLIRYLVRKSEGEELRVWVPE
jgi:hypothetical protein